ncbi:hypothetical protein AGOR_G00216860 [Albula goreensis]|uniref:Protein Shroom2 n=1 Tax=Albula goreensis TaxID=1534307 RepID=A0A8T3CQV1_9TELE|nr:hypothetical protein AGOR_G00216860 [Albula goreensis]
MDAVGHSTDLRYTGKECRPAQGILHQGVEGLGTLEQRVGDCEGWRLVDVLLTGGAPWGFTLRGGREHHEPLLITKVEEGSKAAAVRLQVGDEIVNINEVPLSGYRQEAICLVKGSHKTLSLVVRRRNEPVSRPHSWHSTKFTEGQSEPAKTQSTPTPVWHSRYDASSSSNDLSGCWDPANLRRVSDQFSSLGSMDSLEHSPHPYPPGRLSPAKSNNSVDHLGVGGGGSKRDSAYSSFSTASSTPDYSLSQSNTTSTENMLSKVGQWERHSNGRPSQGPFEVERPGYLQPPAPGAGGRESPSASGRPSSGPVWHVPEKKKSSTPSPPPPLPPVRSDSFAITKVHEKGLVIPYSEGSGPLPLPHGRPTDRLAPEGPESFPRVPRTGERGPDTRLIYGAPHKADNLHPYPSDRQTAESYSNSGQFASSNKLFSLSSTDVRLGQPPYAYLPHHHQRQYSDESTLYGQPRAVPTPKQQSGGGYYSSMQELPTSSTQPYSPVQLRTSSASLSSATIDHNPDGYSRYYCVTARHPPPPISQAALVKVEGWKGVEGGPGASAPQKALKAKHSPPELQHAWPASKDSNGLCRREDGQPLDRPTSASTTAKPGMEERVSQRRTSGICTEPYYMSYPPSKHSGAAQQRLVQQDPWLPQEDSKICPQATPMLHSLSQESTSVGQDPKPGEVGGDTGAPLGGKQLRRSDRFATTLRNEIQLKRAQLQKSRSAAALTGPSEAEEDDVEIWRPGSAEAEAGSSEGSFTSTYKDHLKEAQARVLQATSFRRRDLEPMLQETPGSDPAAPASARRDAAGLSEAQSRPVSQVAGSGGGSDSQRKRGCAHSQSRTRSTRFFEATGRPAFPRPTPKQAPQGSTENHTERKPGGGTDPGAEQEAQAQGESGPGSAPEEARHGASPTDKQAQLEQQRLGTFAEYEATWNVQRKPSEARPSGRYHSADNILDSGVEERNKPSYIHERSRSSPSADLYGENIPIPGRKLAEHSQSEPKPAGQERAGSRVFDGHPAPVDPHEALAPHHSSASNPPPVARKKGPAPLRPPPPKLDKYKRLGSSSSLSDSQESLLGAPGSRSARPRSPSTEPAPPPSSGPSPKGDPHQGTGVEDTHRETLPKPEPPALPPSSSSSSSFMPASLLKPSMDGQRSPSPQFAPQRLTDRPPVSLQDEPPSRVGKVLDSNPAVRKVPVKIVHQAESSLERERESQAYPPPSEAPAAPPLGSLGSSQPSYSLFCTYTRPREPEAPRAQAPAHSGALQEVPPPPETSGDSASSIGSGGSEEDRKREELARDILGRDRSLADILDQTKMKTTMDMMEGIFPQGEEVLEEAAQRRKVAPKQTSPRSTEERQEDDSLAASVALVTSSSYYSTSAPKAELLIKMKDMQEQIEEQDSEDELDIDLANKKQELIDSLSRKLQVLREARESLLEDIQANNALGDEVEATVLRVCRPNELDKFRMFVGDLDKVVSLLLSLSGRLARVENALNTLEEGVSPGEKRTLEEKRKLLIRQHEDAKELKENLDRRERVVYDILASYLSEDHLADYQHFVKMKSALIIEQRKLEDKIKLGEEQLKCLMDSLPLEQRIPF